MIRRAAEKLLQKEYARRARESQFVLLIDHFDPDWYLNQYPDVAQSGTDPLEHYMEYGWREGRWASPTFDTRWYLTHHTDVANSGMNPLFHFALHGCKENRETMPPEAKAVDSPLPEPDRDPEPDHDAESDLDVLVTEESASSFRSRSPGTGAPS